MNRREDLEKLKAEHTREAIRQKLQRGPQHSYLRDFIYGAVDGIVTTFAIVSGVAGAGLSETVIIILGMANIVADGFSMAVSNYLATKAEGDQRAQARQIEMRHIEQIPEGEREEIRQIYAAKGFKGEELERVVTTITSDKEIWVQTMLQEEFGLSKESPSPWKSGAVTFAAFFAVGILPLSPFIYEWLVGPLAWSPLQSSVVVTVIAFLGVGAFKSRFVGTSWLLSGFQTLLFGGIAAGLAYFVGTLFRGVFL